MRCRLLGAGLVGSLTVSLLAACGGSTSGAVSAPPPATPLAGAVSTSDGTWATVAVSGGSGPDNTYWQLLYRPTGSDRWADDVDATATATNGGLDLAGTPSGVLVGIRASQNLTFSPVIESGNGGASWTNGVLPGALADTPQALAASGTGTKSAILGDPGPDQQLVSTSGDITHWSQVTTAGAVEAAAPGCGLSALEAVGYAQRPDGGSTLLLGAACSAPGVAGLYVLAPGRPPALSGPPVPPGAVAEVMALAPEGPGSPGTSGTAVLLGLRQHGHLSLVTAQADSNLHSWNVSAPLTVEQPQDLVSVTYGSGRFEVLLAQSGQPSLHSVDPTSGRWQTGPDPPAASAVVVSLGQGQLASLVPAGTTINSWDLTAAGSSWTAQQAIQVPVLFGSTS